MSRVLSKLFPKYFSYFSSSFSGNSMCCSGSSSLHGFNLN